MKGYIYSLSCPVTNEIKYIGQTINLDLRFKEHCSSSTPGNKKWIKELKANNLKPMMEVVEEIEGSKNDLLLAERFWITQFKCWGFNLNNIIVTTNSNIKHRKEIRIVNPSNELMVAIEQRALLENRNIPNLVETILNKEFKIKAKIK